MRTLILAALILCAAPAPAAEWDGDRIKLSAEELKRCQTEGGCVVITVHTLQMVIEAAQSCLKRNSV